MTVTFEVPGRVVGKERPRCSTRHGHVYTPSRTTAYERTVGLCALAALGRRVAWRQVGLEILWYCPRRRRADLDNALKSWLDGLQGIVYDDDQQVVAVRMVVCPTTQSERVQVTVTGQEG